MAETAKKPTSNRSKKERRNTLFLVLDGVLSLSHKKIHAEIVGDDKFIDKIELVEYFKSGTHCMERTLTARGNLAEFLKENKKRLVCGVYCIYNTKTGEILDVGKSKKLNRRIREQLIGFENRDGILRFTRLFYAVIKKDKEINEKEYKKLTKEERLKLAAYYQNIIFKSDNSLRVCSTKDHIRAIVLEDALIRFFKNKKQCKYNFQD
jgi:hypothetical protein